MATSNNWDLRAGFTKDYDLATSAVSAADKQFTDAQKIIENAYKLDKTAATQQFDIERMNAENLEKTMASQARVGDFESAQEIQRALESLGTSTVEVPEGQAPEQQEQYAVKSMAVDENGVYGPDPRAPIIAAPNEQRPPASQPRVRPMTRREQLSAIEPMLKTPKAKFALRQMVQKEATSEALALHNIAPDEAFNMLIKEGVIRGTPLVANDDGVTYSRMMPDGRNRIVLDRTEAAAYVGDTINKTNNMFKLAESKLKQEQKLMYGTQMEANKSTFRQDDEVQKAKLRSELERQKAELQARLDNIRTGNDAGLVRLRAGLEGGNIALKARLDNKGGSGASDGEYQAGSLNFVGGESFSTKQSAPKTAGKSVDASKLSASEAAKVLAQIDDAIVKAGTDMDKVNFLKGKREELTGIVANKVTAIKNIEATVDKAVREINGMANGRVDTRQYNVQIRSLSAAAKKAFLDGKPDEVKKLLADIEDVKSKALKQ